MTIREFEKELQEEVCEDVSIQRTQADIAGVYYKDRYLGISTPPEYVFDTVNMAYTDNPPWWSGQKERVVFRSRPLLKHLIRFKLQHILK